MCRNLASIILFVLCSYYILPAQDTSLVLQYTPDKGLHLLHAMGQGQTVFRLSRFLGVDMAAIKKANPNVNLDQLQTGQQLILPINKGKINHHPVEANNLPAYYHVGKGENWFRIGRIYTDQDLNRLKALNGLKDDALGAGQVIQIGWVRWPSSNIEESRPEHQEMTLSVTSPYKSSAPVGATDITHSPADDLPAGVFNPFQTDQPGEPKKEQVTDTTSVQIAGPPLSDTLLMRREVTVKGIAFWDQRDSAAVEFLALHRSAPVNSKIVLYNPMMDRQVVATVVSKLEENSYPENISVVISPSVATALGALDRRFLVKMTYFE